MIDRAPAKQFGLPAPPWRVRWLDGATAVVGTDIGPDPEHPQGQVHLLDVQKGTTLWASEPGPWQVLDMALSADGVLVAVAEFADRGDTLATRTRVLRARTGQQVWPRPADEQEQTFYSKRYFPRSVAFTPDGRFLWSSGPVVIEGGEPVSRVWRLDLGSFRREDVLEQDRDVLDLAVSPNGAFVAIACGDGLLVVDADGGELFNQEQPYRVSAVVVDPGSTFIAAGCDDGAVRLVTADNKPGPLIRTPQDQPVTAVAFSPDGTAVAVVVEDGVGVYQVADGRARFPLAHVPESSTAVFSPDLRLLAVNQTMDDPSNAGLVVLDARTGIPIWQHVTEDRVVDLVFSLDGGQVLAGGATAGLTGYVHVYDTGSIRATRTLGGAVTSVVAGTNPREPLVGVADTERFLLTFPADTKTDEVRLRRRHPGLVTAIAFSADNQDTITGCVDGGVRLFRGSALEAWLVQCGGPITEVACAGEWVAAGGSDRKVHLLRRATGEVLWERQLQGAVTALAFAPDATRLAAGCADHSTRILDSATGAETHSVTQAGKVVAVAFTPDGTGVASGNEDGTAVVLDPATGEVRLRLGHTNAITAVAVSPDSRLLATGSTDKTVHLTSLAAPAIPPTPVTEVDFPAPVTALAFSSAGPLAVVTEDAVVTVLDPATAAPVFRLIHPDRVRGVAFTGDGALLVTGCDDKVARIVEVGR
ncbi:WD40 repeat domain-containing protein [Amycolatopsis vastitatis]|uniref:Pyrrolo-quinoline quinone repeat domain-containing protein n=1 Tax=Amycolatopsis vastitatis TaxID=1905142 RepID=A0A229TEJ7_9PSEU|nr:WD40 repeat domain-containing protein [Amycolatopsis vastitatis]OXM69588.1 hypothetical protein CF165_08750 [Amycolatopsis vastitatis]